MSRGPVRPALFLALPWLFLVLGLALTYVVQNGPRQSARQAWQNGFSERSERIVHNIERRLKEYEQVLEGVAGLYAVHQQVERAQFVRYVEALKLQGKYPGIQGVGFSQYLQASQLQQHQSHMRSSGLPYYAITPPGERTEYSAIVVLEPPNWRNQRALGYDMFSEPVRRAAMERARDLNTTSISGKVRLVQETDHDVQAGFLMYLPVYRQPSPAAAPPTLEDRRSSLVGWVYAPFRMSDFISGILGEHGNAIHEALQLRIYDGNTTAPANLLYSSPSPPASLPAAPDSATEAQGTPARRDGQLAAQHRLNLMGHTWTLSMETLPAFEAQGRTVQADAIAVAGAIVSALLAAVIWLLVNGHSRAVAMARSMTQELRSSEHAQRRLNRALRLLSDCNTALVHAQQEHRLLSDICRLCVESGGYLMAWVAYAEHDESRTVRPIAQSGYEQGYLDGMHLTWADTALGRGPTGTAIRTGRTCVNQDVLTNPAMAPWRDAAMERGYQSSVSLPLISETEVMGALTLYASEAHAFDTEELKLLEELANDLAYGITTLRTRAAHAAAKERLQFLAHFDALTHLPNRLLLRDRFAHAALIAQSDPSISVTMLYIDLDHFKHINDSLGYAVGDRVLVQIVDRLRSCVPPSSTVSRMSGDEFVLLLVGPLDTAGVSGIAGTVCDALSEPVPLDNHLLNMSCSIGIGLYPSDGKDFDTLLRHAHTAVDSAKEAGRNTYRFFTRAMNDRLSEQIRLTGGLAQALRNHELLLHYQPQINIASGRIVGAEALLRWQHPTDGLVPPGKFIAQAERSGHIVAMGEWVLREACRQAAQWARQRSEPLVMAVNLSALQFKHGNVLELVTRTLQHSGLPPERLELELTESILLQDVELTMKTLQQLKALGVKLSIDDFGTGYSSLSYLKQLSVDKLKIDQSFVRDMLTSADGASIVKAIIQLAHTLQLTVIAEGVETQEQLDFLAEAGCDEGQGYLFSRPVPAEQWAPLLA